MPTVIGIRDLHSFNGGKFFAKKSARLHNFQIELLTPRTVAKKDPTGLIFQTNYSISITIKVFFQHYP